MRIKEIRLARGLSQVELAKKLGVSKQSVSNWENDNIQPSVEMVISLAKFFSVTTDYLLEIENGRSLCVAGLSDEQIAHLQAIVSYLKGANS